MGTFGSTFGNEVISRLGHISNALNPRVNRNTHLAMKFSHMFLLVLSLASSVQGAKGAADFEGVTTSADGVAIHYRSSGTGQTALLFAHGWLGSSQWWEDQARAFSSRFRVVRIDLAGHGKSGTNRKQWTAKAYGQDIRAVADALSLKRIVLIGHSMSGTNIVEAYHLLPARVVALVPVDTLVDLDRVPSEAETEQFFTALKNDWKNAIETGFPQFMFTKKSPASVVHRIIQEGVAMSPQIAIPALETVYRTDIRGPISRVAVPVRSINSDLYPTNAQANRKYIADFDYKIISGIGHYPMLEAPQLFEKALDETLTSLGLKP
jgi:pimeloyl-ACP methyl ester carboxylesterase